MGVSKFSTNSLKNPLKYSSFLAGNAAVVGTSYESIATTVLGSGSTNSVTFSSIPQTYTHLQVRMILQGTTAYNVPFLGHAINGDTGNNYATIRILGDGASASSLVSTSSSQIILPRYPDTATPSYTNMFGAIIVDYLDYTNVNKYTTVRAFGGYDANGSGQIGINGGLWLNTAAVTSLTFQTNGMAQYSHFALYGIKGA
jgi:hypothetical protein